MISKGQKSGLRVIVNDKSNAHNGKLGIILQAYQNGVGYAVRLSDQQTYHFDFHQLSIAKLRTQIPQNPVAPAWSFEEAAGLEYVATKLIQDYPPAQYAYIEIGNSPALVLEYIRQEFSQSHALNIISIPLSKVDSETYVEHLANAEEQKNVLLFLQPFLTEEKLGGKMPLVIDYSSGQSLRIVAFYLQQYFQQARISSVCLRSGSDIPITEGLGNLTDVEEMAKEDQPLLIQIAHYRKQIEMYGPIKSIDPAGIEGTLFLQGLMDRRWKTDLGYRIWNDVYYINILKGNTHLERDPVGEKKVVDDVRLLREALKAGPTL